MSKTIRQTVTFKADAHAVYEALMDEKKHSAFTGGDARINRKAGGTFNVWNGDIEGKNVELIQDEKIVQSWRYSDWPEGVYSTATFIFEKLATGTRLKFTQTGVPDEKYEDIKQGWQDYYWKPLKEYLK